jgi:hypothetical protein
MFHTLSSCKCAEFQIDWTDRSELNINYKIVSIQTDRKSIRNQVKEKFCKNMVPLGSIEIIVRYKVPARIFSQETLFLKVISKVT